jgi:hypothetical protein
MCRARICFAIALLFGASACAQTFNFDKDREPVVSLDGLWRFHTGDDLRWAAPDFDDSQWNLLRSDESWAEQGYRGYSGFAWYRFRINGLSNGISIALLLPPFLTSYQVFANGALRGSFGGMPPHGYLYTSMPEVLKLAPRAARDVTIAIRVWHSPHWATYFGGGPRYGSTFIGQSNFITELHQSRLHVFLWRLNSIIILSTLETLAGFAALALFLLRRSEREYCWFACMLLITAAMGWILLNFNVHPGDAVKNSLVNAFLETLRNLAAIAFYLRLLAGRRTWLYWIAVVFAPANLVMESLANIGCLGTAATNALEGLCSLPIGIWIVLLLLRGWRSRLPDARLLLVPVILQQGYAIFMAVAISTFNAGWQRTIGYDIRIANEPFHIHLDQLIEAFFLLAVLAVLVGRFARTRRDEQRLANEFEAARTVQQLLIPEEIAAIPGFQIATAYKPAQEVGGDFFKVIPMSDGVLIAIGDVSGKGLQAAMTVSLIVGTLRTLSEYTQQPAELLNGLNRRLIGRSTGGFTTCVIARINAEGCLTIANAGHIPPYRNGEELVLRSDLPLGIAPQAYQESMLQLDPADRLTFISDGVVEAKNGHKELFGFERTRAISTQSAACIVEAAQAFGQEDDMTVVTITFTSVASEAILA